MSTLSIKVTLVEIDPRLGSRQMEFPNYNIGSKTVSNLKDDILAKYGDPTLTPDLIKVWLESSAESLLDSVQLSTVATNSFIATTISSQKRSQMLDARRAMEASFTAPLGTGNPASIVFPPTPPISSPQIPPRHDTPPLSSTELKKPISSQNESIGDTKKDTAFTLPIIGQPGSALPTFQEYLSDIPRRAHLSNTTYSAAANSPLNAAADPSPISFLIETCNKLKASIPNRPRKNTEEAVLPDPLANLPLGPANMAAFDKQTSDYSSLSQVKHQFEQLVTSNPQYVTDEIHRDCCNQVIEALATLVDILHPTRNSELQKAIIKIQQNISNPTFVNQLHLASKVPIQTNPDIVKQFSVLKDSTNQLNTLQQQIDRTKWDPALNDKLESVLKKAAEVDVICNSISPLLERIKSDYQQFPSLNKDRIANINDIDVQISSFRETAVLLERELEQVRQQERSHQLAYNNKLDEMQSKLVSQNTKSSRLRAEQNLLQNAMNQLLEMYLERELELQETQHSIIDIQSSIEAFQTTNKTKMASAEAHRNRIQAAQIDTMAGSQALEVFKDAAASQYDMFQKWIDTKKSEYSKLGIDVLNDAYNSAIVKHQVSYEIFSNAHRSLQSLYESLQSTQASLDRAMNERITVSVNRHSSTKAALEEDISQQRAILDTYETNLKSLEHQVFPTINNALTNLGAPKLAFPSYVTLSKADGLKF